MITTTPAKGVLDCSDASTNRQSRKMNGCNWLSKINKKIKPKAHIFSCYNNINFIGPNYVEDNYGTFIGGVNQQVNVNCDITKAQKQSNGLDRSGIVFHI